ncbi:MAG: glycosyltransferase family 39 protein [Candidatus Levybacteria bacterium]|nr:glycosyltransferase family 39 protein [Candidatus Levybacteria bacterium]
MKKTFVKLFITILIIIFSISALTFSIKGAGSNPLSYQTKKDTRVGGPFEASNSSARYALTESIVKNKSLFLNEKLAKFSSPDVVEYKGKYLSIFTPGISFIGVPFYMIGDFFGIPQLSAYYSNIIFAVINIILIAFIVKRLNQNFYAGLLAGFVFAFATNAFPYALTYTQHILSTTIILLAIITALGKRSAFKNILFGGLFGLGVLVDFPNAFLMLPIGIYILSNHITKESLKEKISLKIKLSILTVLIGIIPFAGVFGWYNYQTTGSFTKIAQSIGRSDAFSQNLPPHVSASVPEAIVEKKESGFSLPFRTRAQLNGFYILLVSNERSWIFYSPIILLGIWGFWILYKKNNKKNFAVLSAGIILMDIVLYSMFGDPWGGWAFGPRYLIPAAAILSIGIGELVNSYKKNIFFFILFIGLFVYSVSVTTLGALTTVSIPPKVEALNLPSHIPYTYEYNIQLLNTGFSGSLFYNLYFESIINAKTYTLIIAGAIITMGILLYMLAIFQKNMVASPSTESSQKTSRLFKILRSKNQEDKENV